MTYLRFDAASLPGQVGKEGPNGTRLSDGRSGHISYGPYFHGDPGIYVAGFYMRRVGAAVDRNFELDVLAGGTQVLGRRSVSHADLFDDLPTLVYMTFEILEPTDRIEIRLYAEADVPVEIQSLVIFTVESRSWSGL